MVFQDQQLNSMTFQAWKIKFLNSMTFQVTHDVYEPCCVIMSDEQITPLQNWKPQKQIYKTYFTIYCSLF